MPIRPELPRKQDFYFSASEARGEYFASPRGVAAVAVYRTRGGAILWATEVTGAGVAPVSRSRDLMCVARGVGAIFLGRRAVKQGDLWAAAQEDAVANS
jgi:hypothetical protein